MNGIVEFSVTALAFLAFCVAGVAGHVETVTVTEVGILARSTTVRAYAFGGIAYYSGARQRQHEIGHLMHERELGLLYLPIAGLTSLYGYIGHQLGFVSRERYYSFWTERMADELGGVER